jgi:hypothetical protein
MPIRMDAHSRIPAAGGTGQSERGRAEIRSVANSTLQDDTLAGWATRRTTLPTGLRADGIAADQMRKTWPSRQTARHRCSSPATTVAVIRGHSGTPEAMPVLRRPGADRPPAARPDGALSGATRPCRDSRPRCIHPASSRRGTAARPVRPASRHRQPPDRPRPGWCRRRLLPFSRMRASGAGPAISAAMGTPILATPPSRSAIQPPT